MRTRLLCTVGLLITAGLVAAAAPALTADNATVTLTVTVQPPAVPCVTYASPPGTQVSFGTLPFSQQGQSSGRSGDIAPRFSNCSTVSESLLIAGTDAQNVCTGICQAFTWTLGGGGQFACPATNTYALFYGVDGVGSAHIVKANAPLRNLPAPGTPSTYAKDEAHDLNLSIVMPCQGSNGAGEAFSLSVVVTAVVA